MTTRHFFVDARWFTREQVLAVLAQSDGAPKEVPKWDSAAEETVAAAEVKQSRDEPLFKGPPSNAMAGVLISNWASGKVDVSERNDGDLL